MPEDKLYLLPQGMGDSIASTVDNMRNRRCTAPSGAHLSNLFTAFLTVALLAFLSLLTLLLLELRTNLELTQLLANQSFRPIDRTTFTGNYISKSSSVALPPFFRRHSTVAHVDCRRLLHNDKKYIKIAAKNRITYKDDPSLSMDCHSIYQRNYFPPEPMSDKEKEFPIAFSRTVFEDYLFLETEFAATYAPQNWYCFAIDAKASEDYQAKVRGLAVCFTNVVVTQTEYNMDSSGHNMSFSHLECMKALLKPDRHWRYLLLVQNHDVALKTNQELAQILSWLQGANDIQVVPVPEGRVDYNLTWTFQHLHLFRNDTLNNIQFEHQPAKLNFAKGLMESALSRAAIDFMLNQLDLTVMLNQLETKNYGIDEIWLPTLHATDAIGLPGGFTHKCLDKGIRTVFVSRYSVWGEHSKECMSQHFRHYLCIFGVEDLFKNMKENKYLFANKLMPEFDFGAISCWHETMFNRTYHSRGIKRLKPAIYQELPQVRYHTKKIKNAKVDMEKFDCNNNF